MDMNPAFFRCPRSPGVVDLLARLAERVGATALGVALSAFVGLVAVPAPDLQRIVTGEAFSALILTGSLLYVGGYLFQNTRSPARARGTPPPPPPDHDPENAAP